MKIYCLTSLDELAPYAKDWDRLAAGEPLHAWNRLSAWWHEHGSEPSADESGPQLAVLCVFDQREELVGIAPWYVDRSATHGRVLRLLGSSETDVPNAGILCRAGLQGRVAGALADYLAGLPDPDRLKWDLMELTDVDAKDATIGWLVHYLTDQGASVHSRPGEAAENTVSFEVVPDRSSARWRHQLCLAGNHVRHWFHGDMHREPVRGD